MKKILVLILMLLLCACTAQSVKVEGDLSFLMSKLYAGIADDKKPSMLQNTAINEQNLEWYLGSKDIEIVEGLASESMIGSIPHSVVLFRTNADVNKVKKQVLSTINPRKWVCVGVEKNEVVVENIGDLIIVIIDDLGNVDTIKNNFLNLVK